MCIYLVLLIPLVAVVALKFIFDQEIQWKEAIICIVATALVLVLCRGFAILLLPKDKEFMNGYIIQAKYYEAWNELVTHYYTTSDGQGHTTMHSYTTVDYHPREWRANTNCLGDIDISEQQYTKYVSMWQNNKFLDLDRHYHSIDGNMYYSNYDNKFQHIVPITKVHYYENKIRHSKNVFNYERISSEEVSQAYAYPDLGMFDDTRNDNFPYLMGVSSVEANHLLASWNAILGSSKRVTIFLLVYTNKTQDVSFLQERYWQGGNKNELVVCVGINDKNKITWARVFSWTDSETLKSSLSSSIMLQKDLDLAKTINLIGTSTDKLWIKKDFREFNYITVEVPTWINMIIIFLSLTTCGVLLYFAYEQDW